MRNILKGTFKQTLDLSTAEEILKEVFEACEKEPNPTPLEVLASYQNYRQERYALQKNVLDIVLLLFFLLPLLFFMPAFSLVLDTEAEAGRPVYQVHVDALLPVSRITAKIDGYTIPVYETGFHTYSVEPVRNGTMTVTVTLANRQYAEHEVLVEHVDRTAPCLVSSRQGDGRLYLYLTDDESGIYYEGIYAEDLNGNQTMPLTYEPETGCVEFLCPSATMNVFIPDQTGNLLQLVVSIASDRQKEDAVLAPSVRTIYVFPQNAS